MAKAILSLVPTPSALETSDGLPEFFIERKQSAEAPNLAENFTAMCQSKQLGQSGFDPVPQINVNPGGGVSFLSHAGGKLPVSPKGDKR